MGDVNEAIATLNDLEYQWMKTPLYNPDFEGFEKVRNALEQQRVPNPTSMYGGILNWDAVLLNAKCGLKRLRAASLDAGECEALDVTITTIEKMLAAAPEANDG